MSSINHTSSANRRIDEELVSVDSLKHVLCTCFGYKHVCIHREQQDPPDFIVTINGKTFPTEVTSIVMERPYEHSMQCKRLMNAIRDCANKIGILVGQYTFEVTRTPYIPKPTSREGYQLMDAAIAYIHDSQLQEVGPEIRLTQDKLGKISLRKYAANGSTLEMVSTQSMWEGEIQDLLVTLIQRAIDGKICKLRDAGIVPREALLLLYDAFNYAEPNDVVTAMQKVNRCEWFHSIFWADSFSCRQNQTYPEEPGRDGLFLFSINPSWIGAGTVVKGP
jgi:hypothetical protein